MLARTRPVTLPSILVPPLAALMLALPAPGAVAHQAPTGWSYDAWCCGGHDCQPIAQEHISVTEDGFVVSLPAENHMTARRDHEMVFGYDQVRQSGDQKFHACILPHTQEFRCLYVPQFGS